MNALAYEYKITEEKSEIFIGLCLVLSPKDIQ